jgi:hypothetical protein
LLELDFDFPLEELLEDSFFSLLLLDLFDFTELDELHLAEEDSTTGSSVFGSVDDEPLSHPITVNAAKPIAIMNFFIELLFV